MRVERVDDQREDLLNLRLEGEFYRRLLDRFAFVFARGCGVHDRLFTPTN